MAEMTLTRVMEVKFPSKPDVISASCAQTLPGLFFERVRRTPAAVAYRQFDAQQGAWIDYTWSEMAGRVRSMQGALTRAGLQPGDRVAILLPNSTEWVALDIAAMSNGLITVPLYGHGSAKSNADIISDSGARLCVLDTSERWQALLEQFAEQPHVEQVWIADAVELQHSEADNRPLAVTLASVLDVSAPDLQDADLAPGDLATLIYTSGTTGPPKGVMLSHFAILWNAEAITKFIPPLPDDIFLSILPLAHAFERTMGYYLAMMAGSTVAYARSVQTLREDLASVRPTILLAVPRLYERIHAAIIAEADKSRLKRALVNLTARIGWQFHEADRHRGPAPAPMARLAWPVLQRLVANRTMAAFGGRLRVAVSGGAALPTDVARLLVGLGLPLVEGYGLTEAAPVVTATTLKDSLPGSVGRPLHGLDVRLGDKGELLVRSPAVMSGYWNRPQATSDVLDAEGWLKTGDVASLRDARIYIEGRLADAIVLSTGENINPAVIEDSILRDPLFEQVCVVGAGRPCLCALIVLNADRWKALAATLDVDPQRPNTRKSVQHILQRTNGLLTDMPKHGMVRMIHLLTKPWTIEDGLLTPTLKIKRKGVEGRYHEEITVLYSQLREIARCTQDAD